MLYQSSVTRENTEHFDTKALKRFEKEGQAFDMESPIHYSFDYHHSRDDVSVVEVMSDIQERSEQPDENAHHSRDVPSYTTLSEISLPYASSSIYRPPSLPSLYSAILEQEQPAKTATSVHEEGEEAHLTGYSSTTSGNRTDSGYCDRQSRRKRSPIRARAVTATEKRGNRRSPKQSTHRRPKPNVININLKQSGLVHRQDGQIININLFLE